MAPVWKRNFFNLNITNLQVGQKWSPTNDTCSTCFCQMNSVTGEVYTTCNAVGCEPMDPNCPADKIRTTLDGCCTYCEKSKYFLSNKYLSLRVRERALTYCFFASSSERRMRPNDRTRRLPYSGWLYQRRNGLHQYLRWFLYQQVDVLVRNQQLHQALQLLHHSGKWRAWSGSHLSRRREENGAVQVGNILRMPIQQVRGLALVFKGWLWNQHTSGPGIFTFLKGYIIKTLTNGKRSRVFAVIFWSVWCADFNRRPLTLTTFLFFSISISSSFH